MVENEVHSQALETESPEATKLRRRAEQSARDKARHKALVEQRRLAQQATVRHFRLLLK